MNRWAPENGPNTSSWTSPTIYFPMLITVDDYHQFDDRVNFVKRLGIRGLKFKELGYLCGTGYCGVIYRWKLPKQSELAELLLPMTGWTLAMCNQFLKHGEVFE